MDIKPNILKSPNDKRDGYTYELLNKMKVIILHDDDADIGAASVLVKAGYINDTIAGIAHFTEHMLFNGTAKYSGEKDFSGYIAKYNGSQNAYTTHDHTCYYFSTAKDGFLQALDMFGNFFVCPLFKKDCVAREKEAVNAEHIKNIDSDDWRRNELIKLAAKEGHPIKNFGTGSNKTLDIPNIDEEVRKFFNKYYSADKMFLVIISCDTIEKVKSVVDKVFSEVTIKPVVHED